MDLFIFWAAALRVLCARKAFFLAAFIVCATSIIVLVCFSGSTFQAIAAVAWVIISARVPMLDTFFIFVVAFAVPAASVLAAVCRFFAFSTFFALDALLAIASEASAAISALLAALAFEAVLTRFLLPFVETT
jgi:hypothetical protein